MQKLRAKKSLGQHFLHSPSALKRIIDAAHVTVGETVLEIGPGTGILTRALLDAGARVIAIEKDDRAIELLKEKFAEEIRKGCNVVGSGGGLELIRGDVLELEALGAEVDGVSMKNLMSQNVTSSLKEGTYALVANIPYYITGAILRKFLENSPRPNRMILLVQKEVANRMVGRQSGQGRPGPIKESLLSISVKAFGTPKIVADVPRGAFVPPPTVDSAIISIENISDKNFPQSKDSKNGSIPRFFDILHAGFAHKRKVLIRNLETVINPTILKNIWKELDISEKIRAEDVKLEQWLEIARYQQL